MIKTKVPIEVSARHAHLSAEHLVKLFGLPAKLTVFKEISQPGQFAANEFVTVVGPKGELRLRVVGPVREQTQVELTLTECKQLGLAAEIRVSGKLDKTGAGRLRGPAGEVELKQGLIIAQRHLHLEPQLAQDWGLRHGDIIAVKTTGLRPLIFHDVYVRSRPGVDKLSFMIDTDEANAAGLKGGEEGIVVDLSQ